MHSLHFSCRMHIRSLFFLNIDLHIFIRHRISYSLRSTPITTDKIKRGHFVFVGRWLFALWLENRCLWMSSLLRNQLVASLFQAVGLIWAADGATVHCLAHRMCIHSHTKPIHSAHGRKENHRAYNHDPVLAEIVVDTVLDVHQKQCFDSGLSSLSRDASTK